MPLIKDGNVADDPWIEAAAEALLPPAGPIIVSLSRWRDERDTLIARDSPLGVRLESHEMASEIAADLDHLELVAVVFPTFRDGRGYSTARLLRQRYGFRGELRAVGHVLRDQYLFMHRCGFDAFQVSKVADLPAWQQAMNEVSVFYQTAADDRIPATRRRHFGKAAE